MKCTAIKRIGLLAIATSLMAGTAWAQSIPEVAREDTLVILHQAEAPVYRNVGQANPYSINNEDMRGSIINMFEPLFYYNSNKDELIPWLAEGYEYDADFTTVTLKLRDGVSWSDGEAFDADDVVFTYDMLIQNGMGTNDLVHAGEVAAALTSVEKIDSHTVKFNLKTPDPRFAFKFMINYFDIGLQIVPEHIWSSVEDKAAFTNFDLEKGLPVTTSPWQLVRFTDQQIFIDKRDSYWGVETGFTDEPAMDRIIAVPGGTRDRMAQLIGANQVDITGDIQVASVISQIVGRNPAITTYTGGDAPFGSKDWWPTSLYFNHLNPKWEDVRVRRAINNYLDRNQIIEVVYGGASEAMFTPWPGFGALQPYISDAKPIADKYGIGVYDPAAGDSLMQEAGYEKNGDGFWAKEGVVLSATIEAISVLDAVGPVVAEQLRRAGVDVQFRSTPESRSIMRDGQFELALFGHRGSIFDPYATLETYTCANALPEGEPTLYLDRWCNEDYDALVAQAATIEPGDPKLRQVVADAMEIWMSEAVEAPIQEWYHRIPMNQTYWTNWPSEDNPYMQPAFWYTSGQFGYVLQQLEKSQ